MTLYRNPRLPKKKNKKKLSRSLLDLKPSSQLRRLSLAIIQMRKTTPRPNNCSAIKTG